jgi:hypothetical protein
MQMRGQFQATGIFRFARTQCPLNERMGMPHIWSGHFGEEKNLLYRTSKELTLLSSLLLLFYWFHKITDDVSVYPTCVTSISSTAKIGYLRTMEWTAQSRRRTSLALRHGGRLKMWKIVTAKNNCRIDVYNPAHAVSDLTVRAAGSV